MVGFVVYHFSNKGFCDTFAICLNLDYDYACTEGSDLCPVLTYGTR